MTKCSCISRFSIALAGDIVTSQKLLLHTFVPEPWAKPGFGDVSKKCVVRCSDGQARGSDLSADMPHLLLTLFCSFHHCLESFVCYFLLELFSFSLSCFSFPALVG
jgi:hypothetical protein